MDLACHYPQPPCEPLCRTNLGLEPVQQVHRACRMRHVVILQHLRALYNRWERQRRARRIGRDLQLIGYTPRDLCALAHLSADLGLQPQTRPTLTEVLAAWQRGTVHDD